MTMQEVMIALAIMAAFRTSYAVFCRYQRRLDAFYDEWNGKEKTRHQKCLEHITQLEKDLGIIPTERFYAKPMPMSYVVGGGGDSAGNSYVETYGVVGKHTSPQGVVTDTYGTTRHPVPTPSCTCAICSDFTKMTLSARRLRDELVQSYGVPA